MCSNSDCISTGFDTLVHYLWFSDGPPDWDDPHARLQVSLCVFSVALLIALLLAIRFAWWWYGDLIATTIRAVERAESRREDDYYDASPVSRKKAR